MKREMKRLYIIIIVVAMSLFMIFISTAVPILTSPQDFSILNPNWNGCSDLGTKQYQGGSLVPNYKVAGSGTDLKVVQKSLTDYDVTPSKTAIVMLGPTQSFTADEVDYLDNFLTRGGSLLLADDFGVGNQLLSSLGMNSRFSNQMFISLGYNKEPEYSMTSDISAPFKSNVSYVLLNHPSTLLTGENTTIFARTSTGWLDRDKDYIQDPEENRGPFPLLAMETYGAGRVILLSDPSIMINSQLDELYNEQFVMNLFDYVIPEGGKVIFDESHWNSDDTLMNAGILMSNMPPAFGVVLIMGFMVIVLFISMDLSPESIAGLMESKYAKKTTKKAKKFLARFSSSKRIRKRDVLVRVSKRHPDWDTKLLKQLLDTVDK